MDGCVNDSLDFYHRSPLVVSCVKLKLCPNSGSPSFGKKWSTQPTESHSLRLPRRLWRANQNETVWSTVDFLLAVPSVFCSYSCSLATELQLPTVHKMLTGALWILGRAGLGRILPLDPSSLRMAGRICWTHFKTVQLSRTDVTQSVFKFSLHNLYCNHDNKHPAILRKYWLYSKPGSFPEANWVFFLCLN